jgi:hypothetical protein
MKTKHILVLLAVVTAALVGCSSLTQSPQLVISKVNPVFAIGDTANITVTFKNINKVDAIIQHSQYTFRGQNTGSAGISQSPVYTHSMFVAGEADSVNMVVTVAGLTGIRTALGPPVTMWMKFWGTDAYGYNKGFTTDSVAINCN